MNPLSLSWHLLTIIGKLPEELIVKILFQYSGLRHPMVNMLLKSTKNEEYENLQKLPFSKSIYKFFLNKEKYEKLFDLDIMCFTNNKQCLYYKEHDLDLNYNDPGYFIPRQFGCLYYSILNENNEVINNQEIDWSSHLKRNKDKLEYKLKFLENNISKLLSYSLNKSTEKKLLELLTIKNVGMTYKIEFIKNYFQNELNIIL